MALKPMSRVNLKSKIGGSMTPQKGWVIPSGNRGTAVPTIFLKEICTFLQRGYRSRLNRPPSWPSPSLPRRISSSPPVRMRRVCLVWSWGRGALMYCASVTNKTAWWAYPLYQVSQLLPRPYLKQITRVSILYKHAISAEFVVWFPSCKSGNFWWEFQV